MSISKENMLLIGGGVLVLMVWRLRYAKPIAIDPKSNPDSWFEDQWARLHGRDLSLNGDHGAPSHYDPYGVTNAMGWNYAWDGSILGNQTSALTPADAHQLQAAYA